VTALDATQLFNTSTNGCGVLQKIRNTTRFKQELLDVFSALENQCRCDNEGGIERRERGMREALAMWQPDMPRCV
jgi:hypothetical protein